MNLCEKFKQPTNYFQIVKWIKAGDIAKLEYATLLGKGKFIMGKPSWNDEARNFIKNVPRYMVRFSKLKL